jgi:hypothetical protein
MGFLLALFITSMVALPGAINEQGPRFYFRWLLCTVTVALPIAFTCFYFLLSCASGPEWKGAAEHWSECLTTSKIVFAPFILSAAIALYMYSVLRLKKHYTYMLVSMQFGVLITVIFIFHALFFGGTRALGALLVPAAACVWYGIAAHKLSREQGQRNIELTRIILYTLPVWEIGIFWSRHIYYNLPDYAPGCYIVTAASYGHKSIVKPLYQTQHKDKLISVNQQLLTLWRFEQVWKSSFPLSHKCFRAAYNRTGPLIARQIRFKFMADIIYLMIKPVEWLAFLIVKSQIVKSP